MSEVRIQCAECQQCVPESELTYDDQSGCDLCEDCLAEAESERYVADGEAMADEDRRNGDRS